MGWSEETSCPVETPSDTGASEAFPRKEKPMVGEDVAFDGFCVPVCCRSWKLSDLAEYLGTTVLEG